MKKKIIIALSLVAAIAITLILIPGIQSALVKGQMTDRLSNLRQLHLAIQTYSLDKFSEGSNSTFPKSLQELTKGNYLSQSDLDKLIKNSNVIYTPPKGKIKSNDIILTSNSKGGVTTVTVGGNIHFEPDVK